MFNKNSFAIFGFVHLTLFSLLISFTLSTSSKQLHPNNNINNSTLNNIDLYLPQWISHTNTYSSLSSDLYSSLKKGKHNKHLFILSKEFISKIETLKQQAILNSIIQKEINIEATKYPKHIPIYVFPSMKLGIKGIMPSYVYSQTNMKNFNDNDYMNNLFMFEPAQIHLTNKPQCIPTMALLSFKNTSPNAITIKNVRSDLYQVTIFLYQQTSDKTQYFNPKINYPRKLNANSSITFQIIILPDDIGVTVGYIYIDIIVNETNSVIIYPVSYSSIENIYKVKPIYYPHWQTSKQFSFPLNIYNPHNDLLTIKEVINSFNSISLLWPNGSPVSNRNIGVSSTMITIQSKQNKHIMYLNYNKDVLGVEYGLIQIKTDKDTLIIPVLIKVDNIILNSFPKEMNFGLVSLNNRSRIRRAIPLTLSNLSQDKVNIKGVYKKVDDKEVEFVYVDVNKRKECAILPYENKFIGYLILNTDLIVNSNNHSKDDNEYEGIKHVKGKIYIEINNVQFKFIEINYEYYIDIKGKYVQSDSIKYLNISSSYMDGESVQDEIGTTVVSYDYPYLASFIYDNIESNVTMKEAKEIKVSKYLSVYASLISGDISQLKLSFEYDNKGNDHNNNYYYYHIPLMLNQFVYDVFSFNIYDDLINLYICDKGIDTITKCSKKGKHTLYRGINSRKDKYNDIVIDYGKVLQNKEYTRLFYFENNNNIFTIKISSSNQILQIYHKDNNSISNVNDIEHKLSSISIYDVVLTATQSCPIDQCKLTVYINNKYSFTIKIKFVLLQGEFIYSPTNITIPNNVNSILTPFTFILQATPTFNTNITIHSINSSSSNIKLSLLNPTSFPIEIEPNQSHTLASITVEPFLNIRSMPKITFSKNVYLSYKELYQYKQLTSLSKSRDLKLQTNITINTTYYNYTIPITSQLTYNDLLTNLTNNTISFGNVQIGSYVKAFFTLTNPSSQPIQVQPVLSYGKYLRNNNSSFNNGIDVVDYEQVNEVVSLVNCYFHNASVSKYNDLFENYLEEHFEQYIKEVKKKTYVNEYTTHDMFDIVNAIILNDNYTNTNAFNESDLIKLLYNNSNDKMKEHFKVTDRMLCNFISLSKEDILMKDSNKKLLEIFFKKDINSEIIDIHQLTQNEFNNQTKHSFCKYEDKPKFTLLSFINKFLSKKSTTVNKQCLYMNETTQDIFIDNDMNKIHYLLPGESKVFGPVIYSPNDFNQIDMVLLMKNNLTIITPIYFQGNPGSGIPLFCKDSACINSTLKENELHINIISPESKIYKELYIYNKGNFNLTFNKISLKYDLCKSDFISIINCNTISIAPNQSEIIYLEITPDFNFSQVKDEIYFISNDIGEYKVSVHINIDKTLYYNSLTYLDLHVDSFKCLTMIVCVLLISIVLCVLVMERNVGLTNNKSKERLSVWKCNENEIQIGNMIMKAYRKYNFAFYEEVQAQMDENRIAFVIDENRRKKIHKGKEIINVKEKNQVQQVSKKEQGDDKGNKKKQKTKKQKKTQNKIVGIDDDVSNKIEENDKRNIKDTKGLNVETKHKVSSNDSASKYQKYGGYKNKFEIPENEVSLYDNYKNQYYNSQYKYPKQPVVYDKQNKITTERVINNDKTKFQDESKTSTTKDINNNKPSSFTENNDINLSEPTTQKENANNEQKEIITEEIHQVEEDDNNKITDNSLFEQFNAFNNPFQMELLENDEGNDNNNNNNTSQEAINKSSNEEDIKQTSQLEKQGTSQIQADPLEISMTYNQFAFDDIFTQEKPNNNKDESNTSLNKENKEENNNQTNSGGEEINFNFNSLFTSNINPIDIENSDDEEDYKYKEISDKPFFENMKFDNFFTSSHKNVISELYDYEEELADSNNNNNLDEDMDKIDDFAEQAIDDNVDEDDEDEPEPEWGNDDFKNKKEGYFDETGTYRIKN